MPEPDSLTSVDSVAFAIPTALVVLFFVVMLFQWEMLWTYFHLVLYLGVPVLIYLLTSMVTLLAQYSVCGTVRADDVFYYSLPSVGLSGIALLLSSFSWCRIPIASVVVPLFSSLTGQTGQTLEGMEAQEPTVKGFSYGFYLFFSTIFGLLVSIGFSSVC